MNTRVLFVKRPVGWVDPSCFSVEACDEPACGPGDVLVEAIWLSLDPYLRGRMNEGPSYAPGFALGTPMVSRVVARVLESRRPGFAAGDLVWGFLDWTLRSVVPRGEGLQRIDPSWTRPSLAISALGMPGLTAWVGAIELGRPSPGETVYVSSAAGAVGQLAVQFAKRAGARVVGSAGGPQKVAFLLERCGVDVYFDNVGGPTLEAALRHANVGARIPVCGMISGYNATGDAGVRGLQALVSKRIAMTGFIVYDHVHRLPAYQARVEPWIRSGELRFHEDIVEGIERAPAALVGMMRGEAIGKRLVQVSAVPAAS